MVTNRLQLRFSLLSAALLSLACVESPISGASESNVTHCERLFNEAKRITGRNVRSERVGLWERLRDLREACSAPEVDPPLRARAALIYQVLPEYSELLPRVAMLGGIEAELESLPAPSAELIEVVELKAGSFAVEGKFKEASEGFEKALRLREALFGEESAEFAFGLLGSARFHAMSAERSAFDRERALSLADEALEVVFRSPIATEADRRKVREEAEDLFKGLGFSPVEIRERISAIDTAS